MRVRARQVLSSLEKLPRAKNATVGKVDPVPRSVVAPPVVRGDIVSELAKMSEESIVDELKSKIFLKDDELRIMNDQAIEYCAKHGSGQMSLRATHHYIAVFIEMSARGLLDSKGQAVLEKLCTSPGLIDRLFLRRTRLKASTADAPAGLHRRKGEALIPAPDQALIRAREQAEALAADAAAREVAQRTMADLDPEVARRVAIDISVNDQDREQRQEAIAALQETMQPDAETTKLIKKQNKGRNIHWYTVGSWRRTARPEYDVDLMEKLSKYAGRYVELIFDSVNASTYDRSNPEAARQDMATIGVELNNGMRSKIQNDSKQDENQVYHAFPYRIEAHAQGMGGCIAQISRGQFESLLNLFVLIHNGNSIMDDEDLEFLNDIIRVPRAESRHEQSVRQLTRLLAKQGIMYMGIEKGFGRSDEITGQF